MRHIIMIIAAAMLSLTATAAVRCQKDSCTADTLCTDITGTAAAQAGHKDYDPHRLTLKRMAVPAALLATGIWGVGNDWMTHLNREVREEMQENIDSRFTVDDYMQFAPVAAAYTLDICGVKARHTAGQRTVLLAMSAAVMTAVTNGMKYAWGERRPDGTSRNSFPSGHTATAFMGAELLRMEYRDTSPWIGVAGYAVAAGVGFFRMYNNRHWLNDIIAGAGVGIMSTRVAYWLYPKLFGRRQNGRRVCPKAFAAPWYQNGSAGLSASVVF